MHKILLSFFAVMYLNLMSAQNLVVNPGAESLPKGTGWTIVSTGASTCLALPTNSYLNWTMVPDGTINYPFDHTTGTAGGSIFYSGCSTAFQGPFELRQDIDVSADATNIDVGNAQYIFGGYMQTPVSNQTDQGRFIVDYLNASNTILGVSFTSAWQSYFGGSGAGWNFYTDAKIAPAGTRKIRIRLQTQLWFNVPAINVYFDDISLIKVSVLPVKIISFTGRYNFNGNILEWKTADELNIAGYEIESSNDGKLFTKIGTTTSGKLVYSFIDKSSTKDLDKYFYRLKVMNTNGEYSNSTVLTISSKNKQKIILSPNPAKNFVTISGLNKQGNITIFNSNGASVFSYKNRAHAATINIASLPDGIYFIRCYNGENISYNKLVVQNK